jgi:protease IV
MESNTNNDAQNAINQIVLDYLKEKKRKRRNRIFIRAIIFILIALIAIRVVSLAKKGELLRAKPHIGLVDIKGPIFDSVTAKADNVAKSLAKAYKDKGTKAIILRVNSPGGSPVQASYIYNTISYYRKNKPDIKVYAVCVDICTSAAYYIASAADEIYANPSSLVGSIGVLYNGFGFVVSLEKLGIERRLITAGKYKGIMDPFSPTNEQSEGQIKQMLKVVHKQFEQSVIEGRGARLKVTPDTFSGLFWTGQQALPMGLIDGFASAGELARNKIKLKNFIDYTYKPSPLERFTKGLGTSMASGFSNSLGLNSGIKF